MSLLQSMSKRFGVYGWVGGAGGTRVATCKLEALSHERRARIFCPFLSRSRLYSFTSTFSFSHILFLLLPVLLSHECSWTPDRASAGALHNLALTAGTRDNGCASCEDRKRGKEEVQRAINCNDALCRCASGSLSVFFSFLAEVMLVVCLFR